MLKSVWQVAKMAVAGVAAPVNRLLMADNRLRRFMVSAVAFRAFKVSFFLFLSALIGFFPGSALGSTNCVSVTILLGGSGGTDISGRTESPWYVGEQTVLYASYDLPYGVTVRSQTWSVQGTTVGGFNHGATGGPVGTQFNNVQSTTFYWTVPANSETVTFTLNLSDGQSPTTQTTFDVAGPALGSPGVTTPPTSAPWGTWQVQGTTLSFGTSTAPGITFTEHATPPSSDAGEWEWVQVIGTFTKHLTSGSTTYGACTVPGVPGLDNDVPYEFEFNYITVEDAPNTGLLSGYGAKFQFGATMYLMWNPMIGSSPIPVPLGSVGWNAGAEATPSGSTWTVVSESQSESADSFQASSSFPTWSAVFYNNETITCPE